MGCEGDYVCDCLLRCVSDTAPVCVVCVSVRVRICTPGDCI